MYKVHLKASKHVHVQSAVEDFICGICALSLNGLCEKNRIPLKVHKEMYIMQNKVIKSAQMQHNLLRF